MFKKSINYEFQQPRIQRNQNDAVRGGKMAKAGRGKKEGLLSLKNEHIAPVCPSVVPTPCHCKAEELREHTQMKVTLTRLLSQSRPLRFENLVLQKEADFPATEKQEGSFKSSLQKLLDQQPSELSVPLGSAQIDLVINSNIFLASPLHQHISGF